MGNGYAELEYVHLYDGTKRGEVNVRELAGFLQQEVRRHVDVREAFLRHWLEIESGPQCAKDWIARRFALARVLHPDKPERRGEPAEGEVDFEQRFLTAGGDKPSGILYDGVQIMALFAMLISSAESWSGHAHIVLTNQLLGTWDQANRRFHVRASVYGFPSLISTTGLVQGPARPREFYLERALGVADAPENGQRAKEYLEQDDSRVQEVLKGHLLQAVFYHLTGEPFCEDKDCRLYNAHWQKDLLHAQLRLGATLCEPHQRMLETLTCM